MRVIMFCVSTGFMLSLMACTEKEPADYGQPGMPSHVTHCPTIGNLSVKRQMEIVNEILVTPNDPGNTLK